MATRTLKTKRISILKSACWPHSGQKYELWVNDKCVGRSNDLETIKQAAMDQYAAMEAE